MWMLVLSGFCDLGILILFGCLSIYWFYYGRGLQMVGHFRPLFAALFV